MGNGGARLVLALLVLLNLAITLPLARVLSVWLDEAFTLHTTSRTIAYAFHQAVFQEQQSPLYSMVLTVWRALGHSPFFARLFSVICVAVSVALGGALARRYLKGANPAFFVAALALNPMIIWAAVEARMFAMLVLLSALLMLVFYDAYLSNETNRSSRWIYVGLAVLAVYTQYFPVFLLVGGACALGVVKKREALKSYLVDLAIVAACCLPIIALLLKQIGFRIRASMSLPQDVGVAFQTAFYDALPVHWIPQKLLFAIMGIVGIVIVVQAVRRVFPVVSTEAKALWTSVLAASFLFGVVLHVVQIPILDRYLIILLVPAILAMYSAVACLSGRKIVTLTVLTVFVLLSSGITLRRQYAPLAKRGDYARVAAYLERSESPDQPIMIFAPQEELAFQYHYHGRNAVVPIPAALDLEGAKRFRWEDNALHNGNEITTALRHLPGRHQSVWLVTRDYCFYYNVNFHCEVLRDYIRKNFAVESKREFLGAEVSRLRPRRPPADKANI